MNTERLFNVILLEYTTKKLKLEDDLERIINSDKPIDTKTMEIGFILNTIVSIDLSVAKINSMLVPNENNNNEKPKTE
jgi:hypothetical protein